LGAHLVPFGHPRVVGGSQVDNGPDLTGADAAAPPCRAGHLDIDGVDLVGW
jgi:hypothetical protein